MLSPYETPEFRHIFNELKNVGGKKRVESSYSPVQVPEGVSQVCDIGINCAHAVSSKAMTVIHRLRVQQPQG